jgi:two-component system, chemotaxis family, sensor kinase CheA
LEPENSVTLDFDATDDDLALFLDEAAEQLRTLSDGLLRMERDAGDPHLIQAVFRAAHTLKGSSATIGHQRMAALTHAMEGVLDQVRNGALVPSTAVIDQLLAGVDALNILNEEVVTREESDVQVDDLIAGLHDVHTAAPDAAAAETPHTLTDAEQAALRAALVEDGRRAYEIEVTIDPRSDWPAVRAYQALMELAPLGRLIRSWPSEEELQSGESGHTLNAVLVTDREARLLQDAAGSVSEVLSVAVRQAAAPPTVDERRPEQQTNSNPAGADRRRIDLGPEMRGASADEQLAAAGARVAAASRMVKVDIARLDELMNLVGELVIDRGRLGQVLRELSERFGNDAALEHLAEITQHLSRLSDDLQEQVMLSRLLPVENVFNRFPRMVRDLAHRSGKSIRFAMEGEQTGLDRSVIDEIGDPLLHLLRNAVDHGVETPAERAAAGKLTEATILLSARHEENQIVIEVTDDGRGIDPQKLRDAAVRKEMLSAEAAARLSDDEAVNLIFAPGFSSAEKVTDVSGRGVGMDIVRTNIEKINGAVHVQTKVGAGTTFTIKLPLTLAIIRALLVRVGESVFTLPLASVQETMRVQAEAIHTVQRREVVLVRGQALPLAWLSDVFSRHGRRGERGDSGSCYIVAVRTGRTDLGLVVDGLIGEQEVVIKSIGGMLGHTEGVAGATILGDGRVSMIVDVPKVVERLAAQVHAADAA